MKITDTVISIPPYISTSWSNVQALHVEETEINNQKDLIITMKNGNKIEVPDLDPLIIDEAFEKHAIYLEKKAIEENEIQHFNEELQSSLSSFLSNLPESNESHNPKDIFRIDIPIDINDKEALEQINTMMHHNPNQSDSPPLPKEMLDKITAIAKVLSKDDLDAMPEAIDNCNCIHCQLMRAIHNPTTIDETTEEPVSDEDLKFREWDIEQISDKLYKVTNPLDNTEQYQVYLGHPIGCNCGKSNCEHIKAVLES